MKIDNVLGDNIGYVELYDKMGSDLTVVNAARVSFGKRQSEINVERDSKLISYMLRNEHTSPFEHVVFTFVVNCPLYVGRQWERHRTWSFNETSRRYTSENIDFFFPKELRKQAKENKQASLHEIVENNEYLVEKIKKHAQADLDLYYELIENGVCREQARGVLPQEMYMEFFGTIDLHNLFKFLHLRDSLHAQYEIQLYAQAIEKIIKPIVPISFELWEKINNGEL